MARTTFGRRQWSRRPRDVRKRSAGLWLEPLEDRSLLSYSFRPIAFLGDAAPGGGTFVNDFEPGTINNNGELLFGADVSTGGEGIFLARQGQVAQLARSGNPAPGGGTFDFGFLFPLPLNDQGDAAFAFLLSPFTLPVGANTGAYRYSHATGTVTPVVRPGVTPAPGGGVFAGLSNIRSLTNGGDLSFSGIVPTDKGIHLPNEPYVGLGIGVYKADSAGRISGVVAPGDPAPGGGRFDFAGQSSVNSVGDVAFIAHVAGEECTAPGRPPQAVLIGCLTSIYVKTAATGAIRSIAHQGTSAPGGGVFRQVASPVLNDRGDIAFLGDLTPSPDVNRVTGVYLHTGSITTKVAGPGDPMPGGGTLVTASFVDENQVYLNNTGEVTFNAVLSTDVDHNGSLDTGLFVWSRGAVQLVARTGTVLPGVGTVAGLVMGVSFIPAPPPLVLPTSGVATNDRGQVFFGATLTDGRGVLLVATPTEQGGSGAPLDPQGDLGKLPPEDWGLPRTPGDMLLQASWAQVLPSLPNPSRESLLQQSIEPVPWLSPLSLGSAGEDSGLTPLPSTPPQERIKPHVLNHVFADFEYRPFGDDLSDDGVLSRPHQGFPPG